MTRVSVLVATPTWLTVAVIVASILLALLAITLMFVRATPAGDERRPRYIDPVLIVSAAGVIVLALAVWLLR